MSSKGDSKQPQSWSEWKWNAKRKVYQRTLRDRKGNIIKVQNGQRNLDVGPPSATDPRYTPPGEVPASLARVGARDEEDEQDVQDVEDEQEGTYTYAPVDSIQRPIETGRPDQSPTPRPYITQSPPPSFGPQDPAPNFPGQNISQAGENAPFGYGGPQARWPQTSGNQPSYVMGDVKSYAYSDSYGSPQGQTSYQYASRFQFQSTAPQAESMHARFQSNYYSPHTEMRPPFQGQYGEDMTSPRIGRDYRDATTLPTSSGYFSQNPARGEQEMSDFLTNALPASGNPYPGSDTAVLKREKFFPGARNNNLSISQSRSEGASLDDENLVGEETAEMKISSRSRSRRSSKNYPPESRPNNQRRCSKREFVNEDEGPMYMDDPVGDMTRHMRDTALADRSVYPPVPNATYPGSTESNPAQNYGFGYSQNPQGYQVSRWQSGSYIAPSNSIPQNQHPEQQPQQIGRPQQQKRLSDVEGDLLISTKDTNEKSELYPDFQIYKSKPFKKGAVFKILWSEPLGNGGQTASNDPTMDNDSYIQPAKHGQKAYHSVRRFVIVKAKEGHCLCVPILTYNRQGTLKGGVKAGDHAVIYATRDPPEEMEGEREKGLHKRPIRMVPVNNRHKLEPSSRINYSKIYTVEHNVKVCFIGAIHPDYFARFFTDFETTFYQDS